MVGSLWINAENSAKTPALLGTRGTTAPPVISRRGEDAGPSVAEATEAREDYGFVGNNSGY